MRRVTLFHDGCGVCLAVAATFEGVFDPLRVVFRAINLGQDRSALNEAAAAGVTALPALVIDGRVLPVDPHSDLAHLAGPAAVPV